MTKPLLQLKFRKVVDVKREKELDERRKNEKLVLSADHPVRKLLLRMRERHGTRIFPSPILGDHERALRKLDHNKTASLASLNEYDQSVGNHIARGGHRHHLHGRKPPPLIKRATVGEDGIAHKGAWMIADSRRDIHRTSSEVYVMLSDVKKCIESLNERMRTIENLSTRLLSVEGHLLEVCGSQRATVQAVSYVDSGSVTRSTIGTGGNGTIATISAIVDEISEQPPPNTSAAPPYHVPLTTYPFGQTHQQQQQLRDHHHHHSPSVVPPLRQLDVESAWHEAMPLSTVPSIQFDSNSSHRRSRSSSSSPPERKRV
ncbi:unnamed protein product [Anisakis simplex]|uniref:Putative voltage-gated potassium channel (inferred by orthology to a S. mansoni protein) n=1 Tax=Anisakis simplex TaxID=6269 RepID=A0A0M3J432_ANISI|nr:unnamed protein product [Anisakis simplex]